MISQAYLQQQLHQAANQDSTHLVQALLMLGKLEQHQAHDREPDKRYWPSLNQYIKHRNAQQYRLNISFKQA